jgi:hypothetical protein
MVDNLFASPDKEDLELIYSATKIDPNLHYALCATLLAKRQLKFPVKSYKGLAPLFKDGKLAEIGLGREVSLADAKRFMTKDFYPIVDLQDFLAKSYHCLAKGDMAHYFELIARDPSRAFPAILFNLIP